MAVGDCLSLHRQLHLDACFCFCIEDGDAHALLYSRPKYGWSGDQITPERRAGDDGEIGMERGGRVMVMEGGRERRHRTQIRQKREVGKKRER